jgi:hypothetical protein
MEFTTSHKIGITKKCKIVKKMRNNDWDFLIILDACRFDFFSHLYQNYFTGTLDKYKSEGSCTREWFLNTFKKFYNDIIYISANPYINSFHTTSGFNAEQLIFQIDAKNYFFKVIDVWQYGWNEILGTVHPKEMTQMSLSLIEKYPDKRFIIHYVQPHAPFIAKKYFSYGFSKPNISKGQIFSSLNKSNSRLFIILNKLTFLVNRIFRKIGLGNLYTIKLKNFLHLPPSNPMEVAIHMYGLNGLRRAYAANLDIVLGHVAFLASHLSGKIIITSDHGEFLGENSRIGHPCGSPDLLIRTVPWFKIETIKRHLAPREILRYRISRLKQKRTL